ncbi:MULTISPECIES: hypothetical protein [Kitasatospora]|uniref:Uncharacterized protein n=1 Tax=Kitasatospora cystarginea TaxID=58350 RepID=A0ABN3EYA7_9ACTN
MDEREIEHRGEYCDVVAEDGEELIAVDGATGKVSVYNHFDVEGYCGGPVASSIAQFAALLRIYSTYYYDATPAELADAERALRGWAQEHSDDGRTARVKPCRVSAGRSAEGRGGGGRPGARGRGAVPLAGE